MCGRYSWSPLCKRSNWVIAFIPKKASKSVGSCWMLVPSKGNCSLTSWVCVALELIGITVAPGGHTLPPALYGSSPLLQSCITGFCITGFCIHVYGSQVLGCFLMFRGVLCCWFAAGRLLCLCSHADRFQAYSWRLPSWFQPAGQQTAQGATTSGVAEEAPRSFSSCFMWKLFLKPWELDPSIL